MSQNYLGRVCTSNGVYLGCEDGLNEMALEKQRLSGRLGTYEDAAVLWVQASRECRVPVSRAVQLTYWSG